MTLQHSGGFPVGYTKRGGLPVRLYRLPGYQWLYRRGCLPVGYIKEAYSQSGCKVLSLLYSEIILVVAFLGFLQRFDGF